MSITLIQPRHSYAPDEGLGHVYMPSSLFVAGSRLLSAGCDVEFQDLNFSPLKPTRPQVGINLVGAPYIPVVIELLEKLRSQHGDKLQSILGGQVLKGLSSEQFIKLFGGSTLHGNDDRTLATAVQLDLRDLPTPEEVSLVPALEKIPQEQLKQYLSHEFSFYLSQGCKYACDFCAAVRTFKDPVTGWSTRALEVYRDMEKVERDLKFLVQKAKEFGIEKLQIYLSNLDLFQSPEQLEEFALTVRRVRESNQGFSLMIRGLSTVDSFLRVHQFQPNVLEAVVDSGLFRLGFGVDGATPLVWQRTRKGHNSTDKCIKAIEIASTIYGLTTETLMVFGHPDIDDERSLALAVDFSNDMFNRFHSIPRPQVAKNFIPGNNGWIEARNQTTIEELMSDPRVFQALDFLAEASSVTHRDRSHREAVNRAFHSLCENPESPSTQIIPILPRMTDTQIRRIRKQNEGKYDL
ncbi:MAG: radical SAM protein [Bdellovibrionales bacterium]|nr:radical SAM protein [Bdellovibrionales bacterium]